MNANVETPIQNSPSDCGNEFGEGTDYSEDEDTVFVQPISNNYSARARAPAILPTPTTPAKPRPGPGEHSLRAQRMRSQTLKRLAGKRPITGVIHRDIRASNILLDDGPDGLELKIVGFGSCKEDGSLSRNYPVAKLEDISQWWSPERTISGTSTKSDVYAFGVLMYEISTGKEPERALVETEGALVAAEGGRICVEYTDLMSKCLQSHYDARPPMSKIVDELLIIENFFVSAVREL
ncbi:hypothetical protein BGX26_002054 [Mortierella sp. AD094]|nr:hypothetical protein BGX26_002054 [Mortierella sp. AD094]